MHSDGNIGALIPDLIDAGLDVLQPLQANCGLNIIDLKKNYGDKLSFYGNIGIASFRKGAAALEEEMRKKIPAAMRGGGYIFHSDHSIPPEIHYQVFKHGMDTLDEIGVYPC
jgi:uroporphyrinogen decarboxylase